MMKKNILVVDDQRTVVDSYRAVFEYEGYQVQIADSEEQVREKVKKQKPDIVFLDIDLKGDQKDKSGIDILSYLRQQWSKEELPIIIASGTGDPSMLVDLMATKGANDYIMQPIDDYKGLLNMVKRYIERRKISREELIPEKHINIIGKSPLTMYLTKSIFQAAQWECDTLILGETGTGKNLVAETFHKLSKRRDKPFYVIHCPSIPKELASTELFGYEGKSFTNASPHGKKGKIEAANGGVVFFNEIGDLSLEHQAVLLDFIETKNIDPVGGTKKKLDVIVLAATNKDLKAMVSRGTFRKDFYYRYSNIITSPPLRDHLEDIPELVNHFIKITNKKLGKNIAGAAPDVIERFQHDYWDGNVRHLSNVIENGIKKCQGDTIEWNDVKKDFEEKGGRYDNASASKVSKYEQDIKYPEFKQLLDRTKEDMEREYYLYHLKKINSIYFKPLLQLELRILFYMKK
ncbi:sigma-54-dependent Fis family transcriptional regulator [bacterium]|nr:sigma-54-dependent Fis family transcriptional regulator [bacterium]